MALRTAAFLFLSALIYGGGVTAQVERSGGGANAQLLQQYQQAVAERSQLLSDNAKLKKDLDDLKKQLGAAQKDVNDSKSWAGRSQAAIVAARGAAASTEKNLDDTKAKMQELVARFRETVTTMRGVETERAQLQQQLAESRSVFDRCAANNYALYKVIQEVLDRYEHQGAYSYLARSEPFTRIKQTQIENLVDEYRQRAEELQVKKK